MSARGKRPTFRQERDAARARAEILRQALADILMIYESNHRSEIVVAMAHADMVLEQTEAEAQAELQQYPSAAGVCAKCRATTSRQTLSQISAEMAIETARSMCSGCGVFQMEVLVHPIGFNVSAEEMSWWDSNLHRLAHHRAINGRKP